MSLWKGGKNVPSQNSWLNLNLSDFDPRCKRARISSKTRSSQTGRFPTRSFAGSHAGSNAGSQPTTVAKAYGALAFRGLVQAPVGSGTPFAERRAPLPPALGLRNLAGKNPDPTREIG
jgi:hypothetical protein